MMMHFVRPVQKRRDWRGTMMMKGIWSENFSSSPFLASYSLSILLCVECTISRTSSFFGKTTSRSLAHSSYSFSANNLNQELGSSLLQAVEKTTGVMRESRKWKSQEERVMDSTPAFETRSQSKMSWHFMTCELLILWKLLLPIQRNGKKEWMIITPSLLSLLPKSQDFNKFEK